METVTGLFRNQDEAQHAVRALEELGIPPDRIGFLSPGDRVPPKSPVTAAKAGAAMGGVLGAGAATFLIPGLGPIAGVGLIAAALAGAGLGGAAGSAVNRATHGVPNEDIYFYEESLRGGGSVVFVEAANADQAVQARNLMERFGGHNAERARREWWLSLRDAEREHSRRHGVDFDRDENDYRSGFEAALHPATRGRDYDAVTAYVETCYPEPCRTDAFRVGYVRGQEHFRNTRIGRGEVF
ncbi:MAG TPA: hypothetical protein VF698_15825 [Thermoanaerobaculia bacterium]|jgi:hypothetical protein